MEGEGSMKNDAICYLVHFPDLIASFGRGGKREREEKKK